MCISVKWWQCRERILENFFLQFCLWPAAKIWKRQRKINFFMRPYVRERREKRKKKMLQYNCINCKNYFAADETYYGSRVSACSRRGLLGWYTRYNTFSISPQQSSQFNKAALHLKALLVKGKLSACLSVCLSVYDFLIIIRITRWSSSTFTTEHFQTDFPTFLTEVWQEFEQHFPGQVRSLEGIFSSSKHNWYEWRVETFKNLRYF